MKEELMNGSLKKIALLSVFLIFLVGIASADCDAYVSSVGSNYYYSNVTSALENNSIKVVVCNNGPETVSSFDIEVTASDVGVVYSDTITDPIANASCIDVIFIDETIRNTETQMTYTATISEMEPEDSDDTNDELTSGTIDVQFNGYKGKWPYWPGKDNITTQYALTCNRNMTYYNQSPASYAPSSWTTRTETWTTTNLPVPDWAMVEKVLLYIPYNWDSTEGGVPDIDATFNGDSIELGTPYTDKSNIGTYGEKKYGLFSVDVTCEFKKGQDNVLYLARDTGTPGTQALYPSTVVVVYLDLNETRKNVYINEEADYLYPSSSYGVIEDEAIAYIPFLDICTSNVQKAELYSFAANAGHPSEGITHEGNLFFNGLGVYDLWHGDKYSAYPEIIDVTAYLQEDNLARIQGTTSGKGMLAIQQILVVEYNGC